MSAEVVVTVAYLAVGLCIGFRFSKGYLLADAPTDDLPDTLIYGYAFLVMVGAAMVWPLWCVAWVCAKGMKFAHVASENRRGGVS